jgi:hypothetical protein
MTIEKRYVPNMVVSQKIRSRPLTPIEVCDQLKCINLLLIIGKGIKGDRVS